MTIKSVRFRPTLAIVIEASWLAGLLLVPLVFRGRELVAFFSQPKVFLIHVVALVILVAWTFEWAAMYRTGSPGGPSLFERIDDWVGREPGRWALITLAGFGVVEFASTLLSPLPWVSVWGRDFGDLGYELYSTFSFLVIAFAIAIRVRSREQVFRLLLVVVSAATLSAAYGIAQHFGWDPIGRGANLPRVVSSFGNPLFFGSYLVLSLPITVGLGIYAHQSGRRWALPATAIAVGLQMSALWFTGGRGPGLGALVGLFTLGILSWQVLGRAAITQVSGVVSGAIVVAAILIALPADTAPGARGFGDLLSVPADAADAVGFVVSRETESAPTVTAVPDSTAVLPTATPAGRPGSLLTPPVQLTTDPRAGALSGRAAIWGAAFELSVTRDRPFEESTILRGLRVLFGFGPDMFYYSYPVVAEPTANFVGVSHAHNYALQILLEQGLVGFILIGTASVLALIATIRVLKARNTELWLTILMIGSLSALIGRAVDQLVSVGRLSDLMLFFALFGLLIALVEIAGKDRQEEVRPHSRRAPRRARRQANSPIVPSLIPWGSAVIVAVVALTVVVTKDVPLLRAGWVAADGFEQKSDEANSAYRSFAHASDLAPDIERYAIEQSGLLIRTAAALEDPETSINLLTTAYETLARYEKRDPHAWNTQLDLARTTARLIELGQTERIPELIARYQNLSELLPSFPSAQTTASAAMLAIGEPDLALFFANRAVSVSFDTLIDAEAWWTRGSALAVLNLGAEAISAYETAIVSQPKGPYARPSHCKIADIFRSQDDELAAYPHARAGGCI